MRARRRRQRVFGRLARRGLEVSLRYWVFFATKLSSILPTQHTDYTEEDSVSVCSVCSVGKFLFVAWIYRSRWLFVCGKPARNAPFWSCLLRSPLFPRCASSWRNVSLRRRGLTVVF